MPFLGPLWMIYLVSFAIECFSLLWTPARDASLPNLVPRRQLANANSLGLHHDLRDAAARRPRVRVPGGRLGPVALAHGQPGVARAVAGRVTFVFSALMVSRDPHPLAGPDGRGPGSSSRGSGATSLDGVRFLRENSLASAMTLGIVAAFSAVGAVLALGPVFAEDSLGAGEPGWGILVTAFGIGMGAAWRLEQVAELVEREFVFVWSIVGAAATLFVLAAMPGIGSPRSSPSVLGAFCGSAWVSGYMMLQENVTTSSAGGPSARSRCCRARAVPVAHRVPDHRRRGRRAHASRSASERSTSPGRGSR